MKKGKLFLVVLSTILFASSCQKDQEVSTPEKHARKINYISGLQASGKLLDIQYEEILAAYSVLCNYGFHLQHLDLSALNNSSIDDYLLVFGGYGYDDPEDLETLKDAGTVSVGDLDFEVGSEDVYENVIDDQGDILEFSGDIFGGETSISVAEIGYSSSMPTIDLVSISAPLASGSETYIEVDGNTDLEWNDDNSNSLEAVLLVIEWDGVSHVDPEFEAQEPVINHILLDDNGVAAFDEEFFEDMPLGAYVNAHLTRYSYKRAIIGGESIRFTISSRAYINFYYNIEE